MSLSIMRRIPFCSGHRLLDYDGKCAHLHGHNYTAEISVTAPDLDSRGLLIDFGDLKRLIKGWIDENWDHGFILNERDESAIAAIQAVEPSKLYTLPGNPTAENMARHLMETICPPLLDPLGAKVWRVVLWETPESYAEVIDTDGIHSG